MNRFLISTTGKKLLAQTIVFSSAITLIVTFIQLYVDFNAGVSHLNQRFREIDEVLMESLTASTWAFDQGQIEKQLKGISRFEQVAKVHLHVEGFRDFEFSKEVAPDGPVMTLPLIHVDDQGQQNIGILTVVFTMEEIYGGLLRRAALMLLSNFFKTLLVSFFVLYIFNRLVTKPFREVAARAREASIAQLGLMQVDEVKVGNINSRVHNEVEEITSAIALMQQNFQGSYQALKMSENRFRDIIADNFEYVFEADVDGKLIFVNSNAAPEDPLKSRMVIGQSIFDLPLDSEMKESLRVQAKIKDYSLIYESESKRYYYNTSLSPVYDLENNFLGTRGFLTDVTEAALAREKLDRQENQIRHIQKVGLIGELAAGFSHDFNNILAIILGNVAILNRNIGDESPIAAKAVSGIQSATLRGQQIIQRIMTFARRQGIDTKRVNLKSIVMAMLELIQVAVTKNIHVTISSDENLWDVRVDVSSFENVIINLCVNSRDSMPGGGDLLIEMTNKTLLENSNFVTAGDYVVVSIKDSGVGIPAHTREKIFEPFFTTKEEGEGTGLGLSTVLNFAQQSYGAVTVDSQVGQGSVFKIYLPRDQGSEL